jgi:hypothetical protein
MTFPSLEFWSFAYVVIVFLDISFSFRCPSRPARVSSSRARQIAKVVICLVASRDVTQRRIAEVRGGVHPKIL